MKICIVSEGCYPYTVGGVSSWIHALIRQFPEVDFILYNVIASRETSGKFQYELPENVSEVYECYLNDDDYEGKIHKSRNHGTFRLERWERAAVKSLILGENVMWEAIFELFSKQRYSINDLLMGSDFYEIATDYYNANYPAVVFTDFLWTLRSIYLPLFHVLCRPIPKADIYHCICTGYPGIIGAMGKSIYGAKTLISEHGLYTREREEELIRAKWVSGIYKNIWIEQFKKMASCAYRYADNVTSLFRKARTLQIELGCPPEKAIVTPNGVDLDAFSGIPRKEPDDAFINIGALLRVAPIKDVKTLISAYSTAKKKNPRLKLWIMGPNDEDPEYAAMCQNLVMFLGCEDVIFTGRINTREYIGRMDMTILTSISEGQPLSILEGFAAHIPAISTNVGCCDSLIYGDDDGFGDAGIVVPLMNTKAIASAILELASDPEKRRQMGENGYRRCAAFYQAKSAFRPYEEMYRRYVAALELEWPEKEQEEAEWQA